MKGIKNLDFRRFRTQGTVGAVSSSPPALHRSRRRTQCGWFQMDPGLTPLLPASEGAQPQVSTQVLQGLRELFKEDRLQFHGSLEQLAVIGHSPGSFGYLTRLGGLRQATLRGTGSCSQLPGSLHPSRRHLQPSTRGFENDRVSFRWRDYNHGGNKKIMTVSAHEFLRRFLLHVLPGGLVRIRHFGLFANRRPKHHSPSLSRSTRSRHSTILRSTQTTLSHLLGHYAHRRTTHFGQLYFRAAGLATGQEVSCRHVLIRAARLRSPLQHRSGSARKRGLVLSNQLLRIEAKVFPAAQGKSRLALWKNAPSPARLSVILTTANRNPRQFNSHT